MSGDSRLIIWIEFKCLPGSAHQNNTMTNARNFTHPGQDGTITKAKWTPCTDALALRAASSDNDETRTILPVRKVQKNFTCVLDNHRWPANSRQTQDRCCCSGNVQRRYHLIETLPIKKWAQHDETVKRQYGVAHLGKCTNCGGCTRQHA